MALTGKIFKKDDLTKPIATGDGSKGIKITDIAPGTVVADGDYIAINSDSTGALKDSDPSNVPAFTVPKP